MSIEGMMAMNCCLASSLQAKLRPFGSHTSSRVSLSGQTLASVIERQELASSSCVVSSSSAATLHPWSLLGRRIPCTHTRRLR